MMEKVEEILRKFIKRVPWVLPLKSDTSERNLPPRPELNMDALSSLIVKYTNEERKKHRLEELKSDDILNRAAMIHSVYMAKAGTLSHNETRHRDPADRVKAACPEKNPDCTMNYRETPRGGGSYLACCGENVIESFANNSSGIRFYLERDERGTYKRWTGAVRWFDEEGLARDMVARWMNSPGHRRNILTGKYRVMGAAAHWDGKERYYATQVFGPLRDELIK